MPEKLRAEAAGILNWAIRGLLSYQTHGLIEAAIVRSETAEYIKSLDVMAQFLEEECDIAPPHRQPAGELYQRYRTWIENRGQRAVRSPRFRSDLMTKGFKQYEERSGSNVWYGLRLRALQEDAGG